MISSSMDRSRSDRLIQVVQDLSAARRLERVQEIVRSAARELTEADGATFVLRDAEQCHYADEDAIGPLWKGKRFPLRSCVSGWAMIHKERGHSGHLSGRAHPDLGVPADVREEPGDDADPRRRSGGRHRRVLGEGAPPPRPS